MVLCGLVLVIASCGIFDDSYGPEDAKWRELCGRVAGDPQSTFDSELRGETTAATSYLFDEYLLIANPDDLPSPIRQDLVSLRQVIRDHRDGRLTADQAREAGAPGFRSIDREWNEGACSYLRTHPVAR